MSEWSVSPYATTDTRWRHLDFFRHETILVARVPRVECPACGVRKLELTWARANSGVTLLMEACLLVLRQLMPVNAVARLVGEPCTRIWRVLSAP